MNYEKPLTPITIIPSGSLRIDIALGSGGFPVGTIVEISGAQSSGKTTLCQHTLAEAQNLGKLCAWIDADRALSGDFARRCGVQVGEILYCEPETTEQAFDTLLTLAKSGAVKLIVLDSLPALTPGQEIRGQISPTSEQMNQELLSDVLTSLSNVISVAGVTILITNQHVAGMATTYHLLAENPQRLSLKLHANIRIRLSNIQRLHSGSQVIGERFLARILKNAYYPYLNSTDFDIIYSRGIYKPAEVFGLGVLVKKIQKHDEGYRYETMLLGKTPSAAINFLEGNSQANQAIEKEIRRILIPKNLSAAT
jgi:recombination protein RecA